MPKIDIAAVPVRKGSGYPPPFDAPCAARTRRRLGEAGGLRDFGVPLEDLPDVAAAAAARAGNLNMPRPAAPEEIEVLLESIW